MADPAASVRRLADMLGVTADAGMRFDWAEIESGIGLRLPADYKLLSESVPSGWIRRFIRMSKPEQPETGPQRLDGQGTVVLEQLREWRSAGPAALSPADPVSRFPYPLYPERGGLLPWGTLAAGGYAFWLADPPTDPDNWPVVIASWGCDVWDRFDGPVSAFLAEVAAARYDASVFTGVYIAAAEVPDESDRHLASNPVILAERPVFDPDSSPPPPAPEPLSGQPPSADFWPDYLRNWRRDRRADASGFEPRRPVSDLAGLREVIGDPPSGVPAVDWAAVHARLGFTLPADYRQFIDAYGPGTLGSGTVGDVRIMAPGAPAEWDLFELLDRVYAQVRALTRHPWQPPYYPEPGGTVCWGNREGDEEFCGWAPVSADPDEWEVITDTPGRGFGFGNGVSFSTALLQYAVRDPMSLIMSLSSSKRRLTFTPCRPA